MSDTRAAMREFRFLDEKRKTASLSHEEEHRLALLRQQLGMPEAEVPQGYYGEDGQWYAYPPGYDPNACAAQQYDPNAQGGFDPAQLAYDGAGYDPNQAYAAGYDPAQAGYDPAQAQAYAGY